MQVTLKKAAMLAAAVSALSMPLTPTVTVSKFSDADLQATFSSANEAALAAINKAMIANTMYYKMRAAIKAANASSGIDDLIGGKVEIEKKIAILSAITTTPALPDFEALNRERLALREQVDTSYGGRSGSITMNVVLASDIETELTTLRRALSVITETLVERNFTTKITLPDDVVAFLTEQNLV